MFRYIVLCFDDIVLCFNNTVLCFDNSLLCSDNTMLCLEKCLLCFKNCLLCLQIWVTVRSLQSAVCKCHTPHLTCPGYDGRHHPSGIANRQNIPPTLLQLAQ